MDTFDALYETIKNTYEKEIGILINYIDSTTINTFAYNKTEYDRMSHMFKHCPDGSHIIIYTVCVVNNSQCPMSEITDNDIKALYNKLQIELELWSHHIKNGKYKDRYIVISPSYTLNNNKSITLTISAYITDISVIKSIITKIYENLEYYIFSYFY